MLKEYISKEKLGSMLKVPDLMRRARTEFEKESGWKSRAVDQTLGNFARLSRRSQLLFGGLLVTKAIFPEKSKEKTKRTRKEKIERVAPPVETLETAPPATEAAPEATA